MPAPPDPLARDRAEARAIYRAIFGRDIPTILEQRFIAANTQLNAQASPPDLDAYYALLVAHDDLEAAELAARLTGRFPLLSRKFQAMVYLAETLPQNQPVFVNRRHSRPRAWFGLAQGALRTATKLLGGLWLLRGTGRG